MFLVLWNYNCFFTLLRQPSLPPRRKITKRVVWTSPARCSPKASDPRSTGLESKAGLLQQLDMNSVWIPFASADHNTHLIPGDFLQENKSTWFSLLKALVLLAQWNKYFLGFVLQWRQRRLHNYSTLTVSLTSTRYWSTVDSAYRGHCLPWTTLNRGQSAMHPAFWGKNSACRGQLSQLWTVDTISWHQGALSLLTMDSQ